MTITKIMPLYHFATNGENGAHKLYFNDFEDAVHTRDILKIIAPVDNVNDINLIRTHCPGKHIIDLSIRGEHKGTWILKDTDLLDDILKTEYPELGADWIF